MKRPATHPNPQLLSLEQRHQEALSSTGIHVEQFSAGSDKLASFTAGYKGRIAEFLPAIQRLQAEGYDVVAYDYSSDVFAGGTPERLLEILDVICKDFQRRSAGYATVRHTGVSLGGGVAWHLQKHEAPERLLPGIFVAAGANPAHLIFHNPVFRRERQRFLMHGYDEVKLVAAWRDLLTPPQTPFLLALGWLDPIVTAREMLYRLRAWQSAGYPVTAIFRKLSSHSGMQHWFASHVHDLLQLADRQVATL